MCDTINIINILCTLDLDEFPHTFLCWGRGGGGGMHYYYYYLLLTVAFHRMYPNIVLGQGKKSHSIHSKTKHSNKNI